MCNSLIRAVLPMLAAICIGAGSFGCAPVASKSGQVNEPAGVIATPAKGKPLAQLVITFSPEPFSDAVVKVSKDSGLFRDFKLDPDKADHPDYRIELTFSSQRDQVSDTETILAVTNIILFTIYPSTCARYRYELNAEIFDQNGTRLKSYHAEDSETAWLWLFNAPNCSDYTETPEMMRNVAERMLTKFYREIVNEGVLRPEYALKHGEASAAEKPLVFISAGWLNYQEFFERAISSTAGFPRYTVDMLQAEQADLWLELEMKIKPGEFKTSRSIMTIMLGGLITPCGPAEINLTATVREPNGREIRSYALSDSAGTRYDFRQRDCVLPREAEEKQLKTLFEQMMRDGVLARPSGAAGQ